MSIAEALLSIGMLIVVAKLFEGVLSRIGLNSIVAFTAAGILLGPITGLVHPEGQILIFLEVGVFIFFFLIGLEEIDISGFMTTIRGRYFVAALVSVVISIMASLVVTSDLLNLDFALGLEFTSALALAGILSLSSLGLVAKVLADKGLLRELIGLRIFTAVIIAEVIALLIVGLTIGEETDRGLSVWGVLRLVGQIIGFTVIIWLVSAKLLPRVMNLLLRFLNVPELSFGLLMGFMFLVVVAAEEVGLHGSLGALLFGAALSGLPRQMRDDIMPGFRSTAEGLFVPLFFASAGLYMSLSFIELPLMTILGLALIPMAGKLIASFAGTYVARLDTPVVLSVGLMGKGVAEIALLLVLLETHVIGDDVFSLLTIIMFGYILLMPPIIGLAVSRARMPEEASQPKLILPSFARLALDGVRVEAVMDRTREYPGPDMTVGEFLAGWTVPNHNDYLVMEDGAPAGTVSLSGLRFLRRVSLSGRGAFGNTPLRSVMRRHPPLAHPEDPIDDTLERMAEHTMTIIPVVDRGTGEFLGMVSSDEILELVALRGEVMRMAGGAD